MIRLSWKCLLIGAVVTVVLSSTAPQADARWWGWYRPAAWGCCYAPYYSSCYLPRCTTVGCGSCCYDGGWYLGWRPGPIRRLLLGRYRWYRGGYGSSYGYCTTYDVCCADVPMTDGAAPSQTPTPANKPVVEPPAAMPTDLAPPAPAPTEPPLPGMQSAPLTPTMPPPHTTSTTSAKTSGVLTVWVPYNAKVTINGLETRSTGSRRQFVSYGLKPGFSYKYVVRAQVVRDGQVLNETQTVTLTAGQITAVAFGFNTTPTEQVAAW